MLPGLLIAFVAGILCADCFAGHERWWVSDGVSLAAVVFAWLGLLLHRRCSKVALACAWIVAFLAGALALGVRLDAASYGSEDLEAAGLEAIVQGRVAEVMPFEIADQILLEDIVAIDGVKLPSRILIYRDRFDPVLHAVEFSAWLPGDRVRASMKLKRPSPSRNPGAPDRARMLARRGIGAEGRLVDPELQVQIESREAFEPFRPLWRLRAKWMAPLQRPDAGAGLVRALVFGDRSGLSEAVRAAFARFGLSHLLAVSGLHLVCVAVPCYRIFCFLLLNAVPFAHRRDSRKWSLVLTLGVAAFYGFLAGWAVPVQRSMIFLLVLGVGVLRERPIGKVTLLSFAALVVLVVDPSALFAPGAQLSFAATAALLFAVPRQAGEAENADRPCWKFAWVDSLRTTATVLLLTAPLTAWHFGTLGALGLIANVAAVPWTAFVLLPASLMGVILLELPKGEMLLPLCLGIAHATEVVLLQCDAWLSNWLLGAKAAPALWACVAGFGMGLLCLRIERTRFRLLAGAALGLLLSFAPRHSLLSDGAHAIFLDVGQGDAILVQGTRTSDGQRRSILIDAGTAVPGGFDAGQNVVVPALRALGVRELDLLIVTHADLDHRGGVPSVIDAVRVKEMWIPYRDKHEKVSDAEFAFELASESNRALRRVDRTGVAAHSTGAERRGERDADFDGLLAQAAKRKIAVRERGRGDASLVLGELRVDPLWPPSEEEDSFGAHDSTNDASLVVRIVGAGFSLLLPGDLERAGEHALLETGATLEASVLKLGHHGSRSSSTEEFLAAVDATLGIVSAPCAGRFGMPHREVVERSREQFLSLWWTGRDGAVVVGLEKPLWVRGWLNRPLRCP